MPVRPVDRRPSLIVRWWLPLSLLLVIAVLGAAKLAVRSVATGQPLLPGVEGAPVLGPAPAPTATPGPGRVGLRVRVLDPAGNPVAQALVEVRDRFNTAFGSQETGSTGETFLTLPPNPAYVVTARKAGYVQGRIEGVEVLAPAGPPAAPPDSGGGPSGAGPDAQRRTRPFVARTVEVQLGAAEAQANGAVPATSLLPKLYVGHVQPRVSVIDAASRLLLRHSDVLGQGRQTLMAASPDARRIYASWSGATDVYQLDPTELTVTRQTPLGGGTVTSLAVQPQTGRLWVAANAPESTDASVLAEVDMANQQVLRRVPMGTAIFGMRFRSDGGMLFVPQRSASSITLVDPASAMPASTIKLPQWPTDFTFSTDGNSLYLVNLGAERLLEVGIAGGEVRRSLDIGTGSNAVLAHPDGQRLFVLSQLFGYVQQIDLASWQVEDLIPVGRQPQGMALSPDGGTLYVANAGAGSVSVIDLGTRTVKETISTGGSPSSILAVG